MDIFFLSINESGYCTLRFLRHRESIPPYRSVF